MVCVYPVFVVEYTRFILPKFADFEGKKTYVSDTVMTPVERNGRRGAFAERGRNRVNAKPAFLRQDGAAYPEVTGFEQRRKVVCSADQNRA